MNANRNGSTKPNLLRVITYHRVANPGAAPLLNPRLISATPMVFAQQMEHLAKNYNVVSMERVLDSIENASRLPERAVLITFDDAYCDFKEYGWPILRRFQLPATLFVPTGYPDHPEISFWWDRLYRAINHTSRPILESSPFGPLTLNTKNDRTKSLRILQDFIKAIPHNFAMKLVDEVCTRLEAKELEVKSVLDWSEIRQLQEEGVAIGAHTRTHPILNQMSTDEMRQEIRTSLEDLKREIGNSPPVFCYPGGRFDGRVYGLLEELDIRLAFSTQDGINNLNSANYLALRRTNITRRTTPTLFRVRLRQSFAKFDIWRHRKNKSVFNFYG